MRIPDSVAFAYDSALDTINSLAEVAGTRLQIICKEKNWLFDQRIKSIESCLSKLETGSAPLDQLHDFYATTVVVPTQNEIEPACQVLLSEFEASIKEKPMAAAESFVYDDVHIIARLEGKVSPRAVPSTAVLRREFEIQVRTGVQFAWWRATHDAMYKSSDSASHGWQMRRTAGQARAALELLDGLLSDLPRAALLQRAPQHPDVDDMLAQKWLSLWPITSRPRDAYRYCRTVDRLLKTCDLTFDQVDSVIMASSFSPIVNEREITPTQAVLVAIERIIGASLGSLLLSANGKVLVTDELIQVAPTLAGLPNEVVAKP
ncbi:hypothetical protein [Arthrobacter sp. 92]|uniref:hypothetical protein n=1 Tax=Arthrobacter sp. 92 TaxID=3418175 RepID=UPI003D00723F